ncbi:hypothetical protein CSB86_3496 [Pseudomonas aeruginosa]|nr:hypothetical protein CSB86_3496 [Pseudomonas aeruginosa]
MLNAHLVDGLIVVIEKVIFYHLIDSKTDTLIEGQLIPEGASSKLNAHVPSLSSIRNGMFKERRTNAPRLDLGRHGDIE